MISRRTQTGYNLVELVVSFAIAAMLLAGMQQLLGVGLKSMAVIDERTKLDRAGRFAMTRIVDAVRDAEHLLIPLADNPATNFDEHVRVQTVPASPPQGSSTLSTAVLAVTLSHLQDMDGDGVMDADNDGDGRIDEDLPADRENDGKSGLRDLDDDGNGVKDFLFSPSGDDDESNDLASGEDPINGRDDDGDGSIDEDPPADMNDDGAPGVLGIDDDGDGEVDEGHADDDDEDGQRDEDWYDPVVFHLVGDAIVERRAVPWDENNDSSLDGRDYVESVLAENTTLLRFERVTPTTGQAQLVDITLKLENSGGEQVELNTRVRVGGRR